MDIKKQFSIDSDKEENGTWQDIGDGCSLLIARIGSPRYVKKLDDLLKPYKLQLRRETLDDKIFEECVLNAVAECILLGWKGMHEGGVELKYSVKEAKRLLSTYKDFYKLVLDYANSLQLFKIKTDEDSEKNS